MTLSVVIPARNAEATLADALDSLLRQTRRDWQATVVDDGSTDGTADVARAFGARDPRIRLLSDGRPAEGAAAARNRGIAAAEGHWLLFLDADDWLAPAFVARMLGALEANAGSRLAYCGYQRATPSGALEAAQWNAALARQPYAILARRCEIVIHSCVLERALANEVGGFDVALRTCEDWDFWVRVARTGVEFLPVAEPLVVYRMREDSLTSNVEALIADAHTVIERAFAGGPADDGPSCSKEMAIGYHALWGAARVTGRGGDGASLVHPLPDRWGAVAEACRVVIMDGLTVGAGGELPRPTDDAGFTTRLGALLRAVEDASARPGFARVLDFGLAPDLDSAATADTQTAVGDLLLVRQDIAHLAPIAVPEGIDSIHLEFRDRERPLSRVDAPVFGDLSRREVAALALDVVSLSTFAQANRLPLRPSFWAHAAAQLVRLGLAIVRARRRHEPVPVRRVKDLIRAVVRAAIVAGAGPAESSNRVRRDRLIAEARAGAARAVSHIPPPAEAAAPHASPDRAASARGRWETLFATPDPWDYASPYEQTKYRRTLDLLPAGTIGTALELACAEGRFTEQLAPRVERLIATDISQTALTRAQARCARYDNVHYRHLDLVTDLLPDDLDLLVCSEVLYFLPTVAALRSTGEKLAAALAPGGRLLAAHALVIGDAPDRTGFDWDEQFGGETIGETLAALPGLALERSLRTELYRIDLFRRLHGNDVPPVPSIEAIDLGPPPEPPFARKILWGGAVARRADVDARERTDRLPVLMYHRVADTGPPGLARWRVTPQAFAEQMRWLRRHGYRTVTTADFLRHRAAGAPLVGRPVMITFDDAYRDFHDTAWPILQANDFTAEIFVVTDLVGDAARWDASYGPPAALMDWRQIQTLAGAGVAFGSHLASHSHIADLTSSAIVTEAARSREMLIRATGQTCRSVAAPFGEADDRFRRLARDCGYEAAFTTEPGIARLTDDPLNLPRIEIAGDCTLDAFARLLRPDG